MVSMLMGEGAAGPVWPRCAHHSPFGAVMCSAGVTTAAGPAVIVWAAGRHRRLWSWLAGTFGPFWTWAGVRSGDRALHTMDTRLGISPGFEG